MRDLAKSMLRVSWTATLFGAQQLLAAPSPARWPASLARVGGAARDHLPEAWQAAAQAGDDLGREWLELAAGALDPRRAPATLAELTERTVEALRFVGARGEARRELLHKLEVYRLVKGVRRRLDLPPPGVAFDLPTYVERAYRLDEYRALWAIEGLGHDYAVARLAAAGEPGTLLVDSALDDLPETAWPMLHAGLGLACAEYLLGRLGSGASAADGRRLVARYDAWCRAASRPAHLDAALESLGLETRCFFPDLVAPVDAGLREHGDALLRRYFWHGLGRAIYFAPVNFIPGWGSPWHVLQMASREAPGMAERTDALAGVAYAFTLVNMSRPTILEELLRFHGERLLGTAFVDGLVASVVMRRRITPGAPVLAAFLDHRPEQPRVAALWREIVAEPCRQAFAARRVGGVYGDLGGAGS